MNKKDVTKPMLESVAKKFNADLIDDDPIVIGRKVTKDELSAEIKKAAKDLLREGDEQFFTAKDFEIMTLLGVNLKKQGLIMTPDQETTTDKDKDEPEEKEKEIKPDQKKSTKATKNKSKTIAENAADLEKKDKKKTTKAKDVGKKGPGVIASILDLIKKNGPVTRETILDEMTERFPERDPKAMNKTIQAQIGGKKSPTRMEKEKDVEFVIKDGKYSLAA